MGWFSGSPTLPIGPPRVRTRPPGAPITGKAIPRGSYKQPAPDPDMTLAANSDAMLDAAAASARQRKRGAGGLTLITGNPTGPGSNPPPGGKPRTLVGY